MVLDTRHVRGDKPEHEFARPIVLAVEGADERLLISALLASDGLADRMDIRDLKGNDRLPARFRALRNMGTFQSCVERLGVVIDAEDRAPDEALASVSNALSDVFGCPTLPGHGAILQWNGRPSRLGAFVLPDGASPGMLEDLCLRACAAREGPILRCVDQFLNCLGHAGVARPHWSKRRLHAYLAACDDPTLKVGEAGRAGCWHFDDLAWTPLKKFLRALAAE